MERVDTGSFRELSLIPDVIMIVDIYIAHVIINYSGIGRAVVKWPQRSS